MILLFFVVVVLLSFLSLSFLLPWLHGGKLRYFDCAESFVKGTASALSVFSLLLFLLLICGGGVFSFLELFISLVGVAWWYGLVVLS